MTTQIPRDEILAAIKQVPLIPTSGTRLLQVANQTDHSLKDIIEIIKCDAALTGYILQRINSPAMNRGREITSLDRAVSLVGEDMILSMVLSDAASQLFNADLDGYAANQGDLWRHDLRSAIAAKKIAPYAKKEVNPDTAFTGGLLHDLGKAIISHFLKGKIESMVAAVDHGDSEDYSVAEQKEVGLNHSDIGYELAMHWGLPEPLPSIIRDHHHPMQGDEALRPLLFVVHLADIVSMMTGSGTGADTMRHNIDPAYTDYIDLSRDDIARIIFEVDIEFNT
ncbi:MAG: HDOD domain-containing protein, partial [Desulfobulbaceae bacterium]|nr:HDOD domain-containing protein [Desulfobulbaceae bacterium]